MEQEPLPKDSAQGHRSAPIVIALLQNISNKTLDAKTLTEDQRIQCVRHLMHQGENTVYEMSLIFQVSERTIKRDRKKIREGTELMSLIINEGDLAQDLIEESEVACVRLKKSGRWKEAMEIKFKLIDVLQSMGILKKIAQSLNVRGQLNLLEVLNIEAQMRDQSTESPDQGDDHAEGNGAELPGPGGTVFGNGAPSGPRLGELPK